MKNKTEEEVIALVQEKMDEAKKSMIAEFSKQMDGVLGLNIERVSNRKYWWCLWMPKWRYPQLESDIKVSVEPGTSLPKQGRVVQAKTQAEYTPGASNKGGRVVRQIPRQLKKIKDAQDGKNE